MASATNYDYGHPNSANDLRGTQGGDQSAGPQHKRTYQACIPCRKRKVRCDLGPVDNPHEPPCVRCRRESKDCYFSATRRKRKADGGEDELEDDVSLANDEYAARNGRKKSINTSGSMREFGHQGSPGSLSVTSALDGYSVAGELQYQQPRPYSTDATSRRQEEDPDQELANETAAALFQAPINTPGDALHLLLKASKENEDFQRRDTEGTRRRSESQSRPQPLSMPGEYKSPPHRGVNESRGQNYISNIDPAISGNNARQGKSASRILSTVTIRLWSRLRFVRAGWFTAREAVEYLDYFYDYINPLTPISLPPFRTDTAHSELLHDEPMLTVTLLTIASRYMKLEGPGSVTRSFMVHERLWTYLQNTITRMFWGQEQFGGGFCGAGAQRRGQSSGSRGSLRSLGTIESLLLLNEFHPRSMHFPPRDDEDDILTAVDEDVYTRPSDSDRPTNGDSTLAGSWSEPALRSDRMCWSLIGTSLVLAYEVGIFGRYSDGIQIQDARIKRQSLAVVERQRIDRIERLLYIFHLQCSGRFGLPIMYADQINRFSLADVQRDFPSVEAALPDPVDKTQQCWVDLMTIMKATNEALFSSKDQTAKLVQNGEYMKHLQTLQPLLRSWYERFKGIEVSKYPRIILSIEYHYINLYINALALQAVLEQWTTKTNAKPANDSPASPASSTTSSFSTYYGRNEPYIKEVIDSSRTVLRHVVEDLLPSDYLKHAPVRTFFRIVSATMFLLKTFSLGGKANEVQISLHLLGATAKALRTSYVDDVHLCLRIADLLDGLLSSIKPRFVRLPPRPLSSPELARRNTSFMDNTQSQPFDPSNQFNNYWSNLGGSDNGQNSLAGLPRSYNNPHDSNISIIPPIGNTYQHSNPNNRTYPFTSPDSSTYNSSQQPNYSMPAGNNPDFSMPTEDDWLTLNVGPLLGDGSGLQNGDGQWLSAFGPEMADNLEVLGKLTGEQGYGNNGGMGGY